jgi:hypothetical protein
VTLLEGQILRFKGRHAHATLDEVASELRGRCKRDGNQLLITKNTRLRIDEELHALNEPNGNGELPSELNYETTAGYPLRTRNE